MRADPVILHVDLDAFYASVEQLADPTLRGRPVIVGGLGSRGVVAAASYEARTFGVHSAMPMMRARRACPHGVFLSPRFDAYEAASQAVMRVFKSVTPLVEPISLDEAFLDVTGARRQFGDGPHIGQLIRARVREATGLVVSVGVAGTKLLAKLASDLSKPDGLLVVERGRELEFLHPLPIERLWGVGPATKQRLEKLGVRTVGELAALPEATLVAALGNANGAHLYALSWNRDARHVEPDRAVKSIGHEETFPRDLRDPKLVHRELVRMADRVASRLRATGHTARTVQLKIRFPDFRTITRSATLDSATDLAVEIVGVADGLLAQVDLHEGVRLLGVSAQHLEGAVAVQEVLPLVGETSRDADLERTVDAIRDRFGQDAVGPAVLADTDGLRIGRRGSRWGPAETDSEDR